MGGAPVGPPGHLALLVVTGVFWALVTQDKNLCSSHGCPSSPPATVPKATTYTAAATPARTPADCPLLSTPCFSVSSGGRKPRALSPHWSALGFLLRHTGNGHSPWVWPKYAGPC